MHFPIHSFYHILTIFSYLHHVLIILKPCLLAPKLCRLEFCMIRTDPDSHLVYMYKRPLVARESSSVLSQ